MNVDFATAMRRATQHARAQNLTEATRLIQEALGQGRDAAKFPDAPRASPGSFTFPGLGGREGDIVTPSSPAKAMRPTQDADAKVDGTADRLRKSLGETLRTLQEGRLKAGAFGSLPGMGSLGAKTGAPPPTPHGALYLSRSFACAAGSRGYKLYVPASAPERPRGLIVMLHGCTQDPDDFALGTGMNAAAEVHGLAVAYPSQTRSDNAQSCWNWFEPGHQRRDAGEPAIIAGLTREIVAEFGIDPSRVFVAGLSAGGAMAAVMGEAYPDVYAAVGVHSGLAAGCANDVMSAFAAMRGETGVRRAGHGRKSAGRRVRTIVFQGGADRTVHPANAERIMAAADGDAASTSTQSRGRSSGGRAYTRTLVANPDGKAVAECWRVDAAGHAWSGGGSGGSYVDPTGPDASAEMVRFFLDEEAAAPA